MRHLKRGRKFGREKNQRRAFLKSLIFNLVRYKKIKTTEARAKEIRPIIEKAITRAKKGELADYRLLIARFGEPSAKKIKEIASQYKKRKGGYTRIIKIPYRKGDGSKMAIIEFV